MASEDRRCYRVGDRRLLHRDQDRESEPVSYELLLKGHAGDRHDRRRGGALVSPQKSLNSALARLILGEDAIAKPILGEDFDAFGFGPAALARRKQRGGGSTRTL